MTHRAHQWDRTPAPTPRAAQSPVSVVVVGEAGAPGRTPGHVATGLGRTLADERAAGRSPVVVWLGDVLLDRRGRVACEAAHSAWTRPGVDALATVIREHTAAGGASFSLPGEAAYRCGARDRLRADTSRPALQPGVHYVVDLLPGGGTHLASTCDDGICSHLEPHPDAVAELVFADLTPWIAGARPAPNDLDLRALGTLMTALAARPAAPRVLVTHYPVEAAGYHGMAGGDPDSTVHMLPPPVGEALKAGVFVGTVAGHDRSSYAAADISDGTIRSDRVFLPHPVFEVVTGAASRPDVRSGWRRLRFNNSQALRPDRYTPRAGYAVLRLGQASAATLHAYRGGRWQTATVGVSLRPAPRPALVRVPSTTPCLTCPAVPYDEQ